MFISCVQPVAERDMSKSYSQNPSQVPDNSLHSDHVTETTVKVGAASVNAKEAVGVWVSYVSIMLTER